MRLDAKTKVGRYFGPARIIALSFLIIIFLGSVLFTLPFMTRDGKGLSFLTSVFTATSSVCVTGLTLIDPAVTLTRYGQILLALLIEIGGISMVTFASFFMFTFKKKYTFKSMRLAQEYTNIDAITQVKSLVKIIVLTTIICQVIGAAILSIRFIPLLGAKGIWVSVFTAISAYCNAGFDLFGTQGEFSSLTNYNDDPIVMFTVMALIVIGGFGFFVFQDILTHKRRKSFSLHTKTVTLFTLILILFGFICFFASEFNNKETMGNMPVWEKMMASLFQSVTARTAGFASINLGSMRDFSKLVMILLMFIGAGSGSTGGGIKITTFAVIIMTVVSVVKNRSETVIFGRRVDRKVVAKSLTIVVLSMAFIFLTSCILLIDLPNGNEIDIIFEAVSAFATVGVSCGVTTTLSAVGLIALIFTMFIGRLGPICFVIALGSHEDDNSTLVVPEGRIMVG